MKKIIFLILSTALLLFGCSGNQNAEVQSEEEVVYTGVGRGMKGDIKVEVKAIGNTLTDIKIVEINDTDVIKDAAVSEILSKIIEEQSLDVDVTTGATFTSFGLINAVRDAIGDSVVLQENKNQIEKEIVKEHEQYDVVIVGSGMSGITTAISLARNSDLKVVVLEKNGYAGGSSLVCGGGIWAVGTKYNEEIGKDAGVDELITFLKRRSDNALLNEALIKNIYSESKDVFEFLYDNGLPVSLETTSPSHPDTTVPVFWSLKRGELPYETGESGVYDQVLKIALDLGVEVRLNSRVTEIAGDNNIVYGVKVSDAKKEYYIDSKKIVLATGGISRNEELIKKYASEFIGAIPFVGAGSTGDGITLTEKLNAKVIGEGMMGLKGVNEITGYYGSIGGLVWKTKIVVNEKGETFGMEGAFYSDTLEKLLAEDKAYGIFDSSSDVIDRLKEGVLSNDIKEYSSIDELQEDLDITISEQLEDGPYYVIDVKPLLIGSIIGLEVNDNCNVINQGGDEIENLYAVGELIFANVFAKRYPGSGTGMGISAYSGSVAAKAIIDDMK